MKTRIALSLLTVLSLAIGSLFAEERTWKNSDGKEITGSLKAVNDGKAVLDIKGREFSVPIASLSEADQTFIKEWQTKAEESAKVEEEAAGGGSLVKELDGKLVVLEGRKVVPFSVENPGKIEVIAFYSSASWCPPCQAFSPDLVRKYKSLKRKYDNFELVLLSADRNREDWEGYLKDHKMPFPSVEFGKPFGSLGSGKNTNGIPNILIKSADGKVLDDASKGARASLKHLEEILKEKAKG